MDTLSICFILTCRLSVAPPCRSQRTW